MKKRFGLVALLFACGLLLASCWQKIPPPTASAAAIASPTATMALPPTSVPKVREYVDPAGWYAISFSDELQPLQHPGFRSTGEPWSSTLFSWAGRYLETGRLPYRTRFANLCIWLANVELRPQDSQIHWTDPCTVSSTWEYERHMRYTIHENPQADPEHRFFYVGVGEIGRVDKPLEYSVSLLSPLPPRTSQATPTVVGPAVAIPGRINSPRYTASFSEYPLPAEASIASEEKTLMQFVPEELRLVAQDEKPPLQKSSLKDQLQSIGYELQGGETKPFWLRQLNRDGRVLFRNVVEVSPVYRFSTDAGSISAFRVQTMTPRADKSQVVDSFLVENDSLHAWDYSLNDPPFPPVLYKGELLWLKAGEGTQLQIIKSSREPLFTFNTYAGTPLRVDTFQGWGGHWILNTGDFLVQDDEILNQTLGYEEIFGWSVFNDKPAYLFRSSTEYGLFFDGQIVPLLLDDIMHGLCCGLETNNPTRVGDSIYFFARRDGTWMYVVATLE